MALLLLLPQLGHPGLQVHRIPVDRFVFLVPADIPPAIIRPGLIDGALIPLIKELAGLIALLDPLLTLAGRLDDVLLRERRDRHVQVLRQPPYVVAADTDIPGNTATQRGTFQAIEA